MRLIDIKDAIEAVAQQWLFEASAESPYVNDDDIGEYRKLAEELFEDAPAIEIVLCMDCNRQKTCKFAQWQGNYGYCSNGEKGGE